METVDSFFTTVVQSGAILAAIFFYRVRIWSILVDTWQLFRNGLRPTVTTTNQRLGLWIILGTIPTLAIAYLLRKYVDGWQNNLYIVAISTIVFGIVFYGIEVWQRSRLNLKTIDNVGVLPIIVMGLTQAVAIIPGVSRSGATVVGGLASDVKLKDSIDIAFIMGIPVLLAATLYKVASEFQNITSEELIFAAVGTVSAFVVGYFSIKLTLGFLQRFGFLPFMIYRIVLGTALLFLVMSGRI